MAVLNKLVTMGALLLVDGVSTGTAKEGVSSHRPRTNPFGGVSGYRESDLNSQTRPSGIHERLMKHMGTERPIASGACGRLVKCAQEHAGLQ